MSINLMEQLAILILIVSFHIVEPLYCHIGYGQRGKLHENGITWDRECPKAKYCFEVVTSDIEVAKHLIDYSWDSYYSLYYFRSCGGDYGTPIEYHPFRNKAQNIRKYSRQIKLNITTPVTITGEGGSAQLELNYICRKNFCSDATYIRFGAISLFLPLVIGVIFMLW